MYRKSRSLCLARTSAFKVVVSGHQRKTARCAKIKRPKRKKACALNPTQSNAETLRAQSMHIIRRYVLTLKGKTKDHHARLSCTCYDLEKRLKRTQPNKLPGAHSQRDAIPKRKHHLLHAVVGQEAFVQSLRAGSVAAQLLVIQLLALVHGVVHGEETADLEKTAIHDVLVQGEVAWLVHIKENEVKALFFGGEAFQHILR